ncbi:MAG: hypothetical protein GY696_25600, partial [Gammaproteobacteria bacterium]|nr:hypothetical protein [Gammaproteobacteria bacterium]
ERVLPVANNNGLDENQDGQAAALDFPDQHGSSRILRQPGEAPERLEEFSAGTESPFHSRLRALHMLQVHRLGIFRTLKPHQVLSVQPGKNTSPNMRGIFVERLGKLVSQCQQFLKRDAILDILGTTLEEDPLWQRWSRTLSAEEKVHVQMVQDSRRYARNSITAARQYLDIIGNTVLDDYKAADRRAIRPGSRNPSLQTRHYGAFERQPVRTVSESGDVERR